MTRPTENTAEPFRSVETNPTAPRQPMEKDAVDGRDEAPPVGENAEINDDGIEGDVEKATRSIRERGSSGHR